MRDVMDFVRTLPRGTTTVFLPRHVYRQVERAAVAECTFDMARIEGTRIDGVLFLPVPKARRTWRMD